MARPAYKITESKPGSDVAGETAAAMAAGYLVFKSISKLPYSFYLVHIALKFLELLQKCSLKFCSNKVKCTVKADLAQ